MNPKLAEILSPKNGEKELAKMLQEKDKTITSIAIASLLETIGIDKALSVLFEMNANEAGNVLENGNPEFIARIINNIYDGEITEEIAFVEELFMNLTCGILFNTAKHLDDNAKKSMGTSEKKAIRNLAKLVSS